MKIALYIEDGVEQVVLTPQSDTERDILAKLHDGSRELTVAKGSFYECRGGWVRQSTDDSSTMIVLRKPTKVEIDGPTPGPIDLPEFSEVDP